jgi:predicted Zn-dependent peptidase
MSIKRAIVPCFSAVILAFALTFVSAAQKPSGTPRQEKLLNGLKIIVWNVSGSDKVSLRLRIHAGSAFDPQEKEGVMKLLSESFFPNAESRNFFREELAGSLEIVSNYDYIQINATGKASEFVTLLETVAQAISNPDLSKDATAALKKGLAATLAELEKDPGYAADRAAAKRLLGTFPYGRAQFATLASVEKIDHADLRFARERLITADNATLAIAGNVDTALVFRAARRYFGSWLKADKTVPSTFRQPDPPPVDPEIVNGPSPSGPALFRLATRGVAKSDADLATADVLAQVLENRLKLKSNDGGSFVRNESHILPGVFIGGLSGSAASNPTQPENTAKQYPTFAQLLANDITAEEFTSAKSLVAARWQQRDTADLWLDFDTYKIAPAKNNYLNLDSLVLADVQRVAARIKNQPAATVLFFNPPAV